MNPDRLDDIFQCIVESYIDTAEPVGSKAVAERYEGNLSPASIRNVMAQLEDLGFIAQPHTSAGRVPTDKGYRYYVDTLIAWDDLEDVDVPDIAPMLRRADDIEDAAEQMSHLLAELTGNAGILYLKNVRRISYLNELKRELSQMVEERARLNDRLFFDGTSRIIEQPEFKSAENIRSLVKALELKGSLASLFQKDIDDRQLRIHIGREVNLANVSGVSIVVKEYSIAGVPIGCLAVMGPTRMKYDQTMAVVNKLSSAMTEFLSEL